MRIFRLIRSFLGYFNIDREIDDFEIIRNSIEKDSIFRGTNLYVLVFAIVIASVGLNVNSTAVIIGAMLISPLMGPINGMGFGIATYDFDLFRKAFKNFTFAVITSLIASTVYFLISPISVAHSELLARINPTIYDVIIALFGGMAGIIGILNKNKGNVIPGVAIATALMPPLCTAGYGLATLQFTYFFGAFYLFTINTVFIAISSVIISQILKLPVKTDIDLVRKKKVHRWISVITMVVLVPSIYFGYLLVQEEVFTDNARKLVKEVSITDGNYLVNNEIDPTSKTIKLFYGGTSLSEKEINEIKLKASEFSLKDVKLEFAYGTETDETSNEINELDKLKLDVIKLNMLVSGKDKMIDSILSINLIGRSILDEIKTIFPVISSCSYSESNVFNDSISAPEKIKIIVFGTKLKNISAADRTRIEKWSKARLKSDNVNVYYKK